MCRRFLLLALVFVFPTAGCALVDATKESARIVGKASVDVAKVATKPVKDMMKNRQAPADQPTGPVTVVHNGEARDPETKTASKGNSDASLQRASNDEPDDAPPPKKTKKTSAPPDDDPDSDPDDGPPPAKRTRVARTDDPDDDGPPPATARNSRWKNKTASADDSDPDTIRIR